MLAKLTPDLFFSLDLAANVLQQSKSKFATKLTAILPLHVSNQSPLSRKRIKSKKKINISELINLE